jgi:hypothetical protein
VALTWQPMNTDAKLYGFDGSNRLRGQIVRYDVPAGWAAFTSGHRVDGGPWGDADDAIRAAERAVN